MRKESLEENIDLELFGLIEVADLGPDHGWAYSVQGEDFVTGHPGRQDAVEAGIRAAGSNRALYQSAKKLALEGMHYRAKGGA